MNKRILSLMLVMVMSLSLLSFAAVAAGSITASYADGVVTVAGAGFASGSYTVRVVDLASSSIKAMGQVTVDGNGNISVSIKTGVLSEMSRYVVYVNRRDGTLAAANSSIEAASPTPTPPANVLSNGSLQLTYAVLSNSNVSLGGSSTITGDTAVNGGKVKLAGSSKITGKLSVGEEASYSLSGSSKINGGVVELIPEPVLNMPEFSPILSDLVQRGNLMVGSWPTQSVTIHQDGWYDKISLVSNGTLTIDVGDGIRRIRVTDLNISQGQIHLTGSGTLYLYTDKTFSVGGSSTINASGSAEKLKIFVNGSGTVALSGNSKLTGSLYGPLASLSLAGNSKLTGDVILGGNKVTLSGNSSLTGVIYMPGAAVDLSGSAGITGAVAANQLNGSGNIQVKFVESLCTIPSDFLDPSIP